MSPIPDRADPLALAILNACTIPHEKHKRLDSVRIMKHADPVRIAANSRKFAASSAGSTIRPTRIRVAARFRRPGFRVIDLAVRHTMCPAWIPFGERRARRLLSRDARRRRPGDTTRTLMEGG